ncbi:Predicted arabinose efflux permease, MFS family [Pedobacter steynii]|uniref:Predicted arabinose efflux permease, MFS family n=1 Tax=Pedobacter steynii TaxID=430522 RepID=A0A1G9RSW8_9SPHI|nr:MFS transporter [Pedobacter steynii]NQX37657.1 MFS transporter [Pedobacter steynii]SDM26378.1 Predicted arabinose efflux permease, MFS family [Pedobacter steynii]
MKEFLRLYLDAYRGLSAPAWMLALVMLINRSGAMVIPFLGVYMINHLSFSLEDTGTVLSCFGIGAVAGSFAGGWLTDKVGHFKVQLFSLILTVPMFFLLPELNTVMKLAIGVFMLSLISETFRPANSVSIAYYSKPDNIIRSFSLNRMAMNLGFSIGPALGGFLAAISYTFLFYGNAIAAFLSAILFFIYFRNKKGNEKKASEVIMEETAVKERSPYKDVLFMLFSILCSIFTVCFFQLLSTLPLYYRAVYQMTEANIGVILAFSGVVVFLLEMLLVHIAEKRLSPRDIIVLGTLLCGFSFLILNLAHGMWVLYTAMFVLCLAEILAMPFMATITLQRSTLKTRGAYMGINALSVSVAHVFSPFVGTRVAAVYGFPVLWWGTAIVLLLTSIGFFFVMKRMKLNTIK